MRFVLAARAQFARAQYIAVAAFICAASPSLAVEGTTAAGPIGGTDIRSALLPPPGLYGGAIGLYSTVHEIRDGTGNPAPGLDAVDLAAKVVGPFFVYVPDFKVLDGSIGLFGIFPAGQECGQVVTAFPPRCTSGFGDPYFEVAWSRSFGQLRPSSDPGGFPIMQGLALGLGLGVVVPIGNYNSQLQASNGITMGNKTWDLAPSVAVTYTTAPLIFEGTEFSAKLYWNQYWTNPVTQYKASPLVDVDFAITEHIGRFQVGATGVYAFQTGEDRLNSVVVPPDGRRFEFMALGGVLNCDIAEWGAVVRVKALTTIVAQNAGVSKTVVVGFAKKLH